MGSSAFLTLRAPGRGTRGRRLSQCVTGIVVLLTGLVVSACGAGEGGAHVAAAGLVFHRMALPIRHADIASLDWGRQQGGWLLLDKQRPGKNGTFLYHTWLYHARRFPGPWRLVAQNVLPPNVSLDFVTPRIGWAVEGLGVTLGYSQSRLLTTDDGGKTWRIATKPLWLLAGPSSMAFVSPAQGVLVGGPGGGVTEVGMFTQDSGKRWLGLPALTAEPQNLGASLTVTQAAWLSPRIVMVANGYWTERRHKNWPILELMTLSLSHRTWHRIRLPVQRLEGTPAGLAFTSPTQGWAALTQDQATEVVTTTNGGRQWTAATFGPRKTLAQETVIMAPMNVRRGCVATLTQLWCTAS
ncbi:MAG: hypothetical protein OWU84_03490 [Firmicutes bacterium]|nr:hypothetical protein [Bacillota bacterium]